jgi:hypothetical protein
VDVLFALILNDAALDASHYPMSIRNITFRIVSHRARPAGGAVAAFSEIEKVPAIGRSRVGRRITDSLFQML